MTDTPSNAGNGKRIAMAVARFNPSITDLLLAGCTAGLVEHGVAESDIEVVPVPGAWELPLACRYLADSGRFDAVIALGAVVRGETAHFDFISSQCAHGLMRVALDSGVPVAFGVLTPENGEQALERADPARKNKGREAAVAALDMLALKAEVEGVQ
jgi:6,7-dimethyl-8-ribityllumazine synthase